MSSSRGAELRLLFDGRWRLLGTLGVASIVAALAEAFVLTVAAQVAADIVAGRHRIQFGLGLATIHTTIGPLLILALGFAVIRLLLQFVISYYPARIAGDIQASIRTKLFAAYTAASWDQQSLGREGHFQEVMTNQIMQANAAALQGPALIVSMFTFIVLVVTAFALNVIAALTVLAAAALLFVSLRPLIALGDRLTRRLSAAQLDLAGAVNEANSVAEEAKVFGIRETLQDRLGGFISAARDLFVKTQFMLRIVPGIYQSVIYIIVVCGLIAINGAHVRGFASLGAVILLMVRAGTYGQQLQSSYQQLRQSLPYLERLRGTIDQYLVSRPALGTRPLDSIGSLAFVDVSYAYREHQPVLSGVTWDVVRGETIGVVGPSGAGKSTMVQILLRLRFPRNGRYMVNGVPARDYATEDWNERVVYVPQQPRLMHASVADNVRFLRDIDDEAIERACRLARIHDDIVGWPDGYETIVGPRADAVSGGQQQRICLARSIAGNPDVLVLDEPTSALDPRSESLIQESLISLKHRLTLFIVAHRMSTLTICDRVMVVLDGKLDAFETPEELRNSNQYYRVASSLSEPTALPATPHSPHRIRGALGRLVALASGQPPVSHLSAPAKGADHSGRSTVKSSSTPGRLILPPPQEQRAARRWT